MMAWTSPAFTVRSMPLRISRSPTVARRFLISSSGIRLSNASFQTHTEQLLRFHGELHGQFLKDFLAETVHDHGDGIFGGDAALPAVENLVFPNLGGRRFVLHLGGRVFHFQV